VRTCAGVSRCVRHAGLGVGGRASRDVPVVPEGSPENQSPFELHSIGRRKRGLVRREIRLWAWTSDIATISGGLASLAAFAAFLALVPDKATHPLLFRAALFALTWTGLVTLGLFIKGLFFRVPLVDVEDRWNEMYDRLRNATQKFIDDVATSTFLGLAPEYGGVPGEDWQGCARLVPIPCVDDRPLHQWHDRLAEHHDVRVRRFFAFARACEGIPPGGEYRRLGVRTYDTIYRSRDVRSGFREWMVEEEVQSGAEPLVVLLAYMEVARACTVKTGLHPQHRGFWKLAIEWHPSTMALDGGISGEQQPRVL